MTLIDLFMVIFFGLLALTCTYVTIINMVNINPPKKPEQVRSYPKLAIEKPKPTINTTSQGNKDMVISGLVHVGMKKTNAKALVARMCKNKYYDDAQKLFEDCFPHIN
jgi:hypothetical protein